MSSTKIKSHRCWKCGKFIGKKIWICSKCAGTKEGQEMIANLEDVTGQKYEENIKK